MAGMFPELLVLWCQLHSSASQLACLKGTRQSAWTQWSFRLLPLRFLADCLPDLSCVAEVEECYHTKPTCRSGHSMHPLLQRCTGSMATYFLGYLIALDTKLLVTGLTCSNSSVSTSGSLSFLNILHGEKLILSTNMNILATINLCGCNSMKLP